MDIERYHILRATEINGEPDGDYCYWTDVDGALAVKDAEIARLRELVDALRRRIVSIEAKRTIQ